ncbi:MULTISPECIES: ATP-binding protein [unclassified Bradyrhizobium]|uniref:ATP-binding protein n=1 Tax=unclassified Bradyrhizobium TaxID=2631580 RepID=UPI0024E168D1|nr:MULTISPECIES: ATP-binding protein [unclassified Bradyrhizobium]
MDHMALDGIDVVQRRPGMYVGDTTDGTGLHRMIEVLVDNAVEEALAGFCDRLDIVLNAGGSVTVRDNGRGIPTEIHPSEGIPAVELVMTRLSYAFGQPSWLFVVNALSEWLQLRVWRNGQEHGMRFRRGRSEAPLSIVGEAEIVDGTPRRGTEITFCPNPEVFSNVVFDLARIEHHLRKLPVFKAGVTVMLSDRRDGGNNEITLRIRAPGL